MVSINIFFKCGHCEEDEELDEPVMLPADFELVLQPGHYAEGARFLQAHKTHQLHQLKQFGDAPDTDEANKVGGLTILADDELKREDRNRIDGEPALEILLNDLGAIVDNLKVVVVHGRVENDEDVDEEAAIDDVVEDQDAAVELVVQRDLGRRCNARVQEEHIDQHVPVQLPRVGGRDEQGAGLLLTRGSGGFLNRHLQHFALVTFPKDLFHHV